MSGSIEKQSRPFQSRHRSTFSSRFLDWIPSSIQGGGEGEGEEISGLGLVSLSLLNCLFRVIRGLIEGGVAAVLFFFC